MGNKVPENKQRQFILYRDIKRKIKAKHNIDIRNNIYICKLKEKKLLSYNDEICDTYCTLQLNQDDKKESGKEEEKDSTYVKINFRKTRIKHSGKSSQCAQLKSKDVTGRRYSGMEPFEDKKKLHVGEPSADSGHVDVSNASATGGDRGNRGGGSKNEKRHFELDYGSFYNVEERANVVQQRYNARVKKKKSGFDFAGMQCEGDAELRNRDITKVALLKKKKKVFSRNNGSISSGKSNSNSRCLSNRDECSPFSDVKGDVPHKTSGYMYERKEDGIPPLGAIQFKMLSEEAKHRNAKCASALPRSWGNKDDTCTRSNDLNSNTPSYWENEKKNILTPIRKSTEVCFLSLFKKKSILQNVLSFLNCSDLLQFQKTCSIVYIYVSDFLEYVCLNIYYKFRKAYRSYFVPFNFFYKYEYLYTDKPSFRLDCILIARIEKDCVGYNNRFGYKHKYLHEKRKNSYYVYFNFNVLKSNSSRRIEIHKDISYNNGDDINVSHIINNDVCSNDYICIPINLYNFFGIVDFNSINFVSNQMSKYLRYNNHLDDQLWYNMQEYITLRKESNLISSECFLPHLRHIKTIYSGIDVTVMKSTYKAVQPGKLGRRSYILWGNYFIIENKFDPVFIFLKREGLQHDYIYHNFYLRVGDSIVFYLIKGGNYDI
ncbi:conserved Plasmodium protein, unknown function [Plasmodium ovale]|uniref:F-box domain-containing protein n=2 Tax=Plasmodium ovale TaxID=36330 RepID=A0A1A8W2G7_PLAOA|nr:conserved Plasmodium protein, unknown function [Plasmodium ovale curtisi]SBS94423.1 conserved Plasmodium protein, unknown function [Plasmodium ovale curtisi]SCP05071.1 conserved Plasmodium protein, unknown function [Plasmodium ovale]